MPRFSAFGHALPPAAVEQASTLPKSAASPSRNRITPTLTIGPGSPHELAAQNPTQALAAFAGLAILFYHFSNIAELVTSLTGLNLKLALLANGFAAIAVLVTGGLIIPLRYLPSRLFLLSVGWNLLAVPFSSWVGGSFGDMKLFLIYTLPTLFYVLGLILRWEHVRLAMLTIGISGIVLAANALFVGGSMEYGRFSLSSSGTIGNPNDLAAHFVLILPIFLMLASDKQRSWWIRLSMLSMVPVALYIVLKTGSRGGLIGIAVVVLIILWRAPGSQKILLLGFALVLGLLMPLLLPDSIKQRLVSFSDDDPNSDAAMTKAVRRELFWDSVYYSLRYPVFGVGPGQFANFRGLSGVEAGQRKSWHATHCTWTQISSESGLPALAFLIASFWFALRPLHTFMKQAQQAGYDDIAKACFYFTLAILGFLVCITFLSNGGRFYVPALIGLSIAMLESGKIEIQRRERLKVAGLGAAQLSPPQPARIARLRDSNR